MFTRLLEDTERSTHGVTERDWGKFIVINTILQGDAMVYKEKLLVVKPNTALQLHKHVDYTELWIGESAFKYVLEDEAGNLIEHAAEPYVRVFIPKNKKHKIISGDCELNIFEAQIGEIKDEDNIKFV